MIIAVGSIANANQIKRIVEYGLSLWTWNSKITTSDESNLETALIDAKSLTMNNTRKQSKLSQKVETLLQFLHYQFPQ